MACLLIEQQPQSIFQRINAVAMPIRPKQPIASYNREKHVFSGTFDPASDKYDEDMDGKP